MDRACVIGFDGATWRFMEPLMRRGELPNFQRLREHGASGDLMSTIPFDSAAAWVTFMTGKNSGKHGVYTFQNYDARSYSCRDRTTNSRYFSGQTIFDIVGKMGGAVAGVRVPMTYPAWPVNGIMISGFPTPGNTPDSFYPAHLPRELGATLDPDEANVSLLDTEAQVHELESHLNEMAKTVRVVMSQRYDLFAAVFRIPDHVHHLFFKFVDPRSPAYDAVGGERWGDIIDHFYRRCDGALGEILGQLTSNDTIFVISDHGGNFAPARQFNVNVWLAVHGLLSPVARLRREDGTSAGNSTPPAQGGQRIDFARTQAYNFPMGMPGLGGIVINVRGRQPQGVVPAQEYAALREQVIRDLQRLHDPETGDRIVAAVYRREELYHGPHVERAPDIVIRCHDMYTFGKAHGRLVTDVPLQSLAAVSGWHDEMGIFLAMGPRILTGKALKGARLLDVAPTILHAMGIPASSDMDGRVLTEMFEEGNRSVTSIDFELPSHPSTVYLSEAEEQLIAKKLRGWGYL